MAPIQEFLDTSHLAARSFGIGGRPLQMVITELVLQSIAIILVVNRLVCRLTLKKPMGSDDYVIVASLVFCIAMNIVNIVGVDHGYGRYSDVIPLSDFLLSMKLFYVLRILYRCTITLTKLSILLLYRRIFDTDRFRFRLLCNITAGYVALYAVGSIAATIFECTPTAKEWDRSRPGSCINFEAFWYANAIHNVTSDFFILLLPMPVINTLKLPPRRKVGLMMIFALGVFVCATSVIRITTLARSSQAADRSYGTMISTMWTTIEAEMAIICSCLPMLRIPIARLVPGIFSSARYSGNMNSAPSSPPFDAEIQGPSMKAADNGVHGDEPCRDGNTGSTNTPTSYTLSLPELPSPVVGAGPHSKNKPLDPEQYSRCDQSDGFPLTRKAAIPRVALPALSLLTSPFTRACEGERVAEPSRFLQCKGSKLSPRLEHGSHPRNTSSPLPPVNLPYSRSSSVFSDADSPTIPETVHGARSHGLRVNRTSGD